MGGCLFAHGQTSTGKTYSILGDPNVYVQGGGPGSKGVLSPHAGLLPRLLLRYFRAFPGAELGVSLVEIYREQLHDLLCGRKVVKCYHSSAQTVTRAVTKTRCRSYKSALRLVERGNRERVAARTALNVNSSRGHLVILLEASPGATLCLVDLAGKETETGISLSHTDSEAVFHALRQQHLKRTCRSVERTPVHASGNGGGHAAAERYRHNQEKAARRFLETADAAAAVSGSRRGRGRGVVTTSTSSSLGHDRPDPTRMAELKFINKSLFHLSEVIQGLRKGRPVCFRNSKLTFLLQDWLATKQIYLLACVSPSELCFEESLSTLRFADCVSNLPRRRLKLPPAPASPIPVAPKLINFAAFTVQPPEEVVEQEHSATYSVTSETTRKAATQVSKASQVLSASRVTTVTTATAVTADNTPAAGGVQGQFPILNALERMQAELDPDSMSPGGYRAQQHKLRRSGSNTPCMRKISRSGTNGLLVPT